MGSHHYLLTLSLLSYLLFFTSLTPTCSASLSLASPPDSPSKVSLGLYYETLCPYSADFIINYLVQIFDTGLISILDLNLVPWGNARILANNTFDCQHGPLECLLNTVEACAISVWPDLNKHFPFIYCVESLVYEHQYTQWETCFEKLDLDPTLITECYSSGYGKELELQYAAETNTLQPPHEYVPWVVVDGVPLYEDYENFISYICKGYKGTALPQSCVDLALNTIPKDKASPRHPVCYREEATKSKLSKIRSAIRSWMDKVDVAVSL
ncbi:hypothetical protein CsSME_00041195 [Camellia sinensis var. sinensis]